MDRAEMFAVVGKPVLHSRSPQMHCAAYAELGMDARYVRIAVESREEGLSAARRMGLAGINVTSPFKDIIGIVDEADETARRIGAVNTVLLKGGKAIGHNTDAYGVAQAFLANGISLRGKKALVLGAGGAARAAVVAMVDNGADVTVANRTAEKAIALSKEFGTGQCALSDAPKSDIIIGCLNTDARAVSKAAITPGAAVLDAFYAKESALAKDARENGCRVLDGREWLLHQGARSFELFTKKKAPIQAMRKAAYANGEGRKAAAGNGGGSIALIGMMGSGKDSVSKALSARNGMPVFSTDWEIERKAGMIIRDIFTKEGEAGFRKRERESIASLNASASPMIINCGGGAILDGGNREALRRIATVVWLWADTGTIMARLKKEDVGKADSRPLLNEGEPEKRLATLLNERMGAYCEASDIVIPTDGKTPEAIAERILHEIR